MRRLHWLIGALAVTVVAGNTPSARAELRFDGTLRDHEQTIRSVYSKLPSRGKEIDVTIDEVSGDDWENRDDIDDPEAVGLYDDETHELFLKADDDELPFTFAHEYGHHVYFSSFTRDERRAWRQYWRAHRRDMPKGDPRHDPDEAFAECYAAAFYPGECPCSITADTRSQIQGYFREQASGQPVLEQSRRRRRR